MTQPTTADETAVVEYRAALVNALRPVSAGLAALHAAKNAVFSPSSCTRCGHDHASIRSRSIPTPEDPRYRRKHVVERNCSTCAFVGVLQAGNPPVFHSRRRKKRLSNLEQHDHDPIQHLTVPTTTTTPSSSLKRTKNKSELQRLLNRNREKQQKQEQKQQQPSGLGGLSAFLDTL